MVCLYNGLLVCSHVLAVSLCKEHHILGSRSGIVASDLGLFSAAVLQYIVQEQPCNTQSEFGHLKASAAHLSKGSLASLMRLDALGQGYERADVTHSLIQQQACNKQAGHNPYDQEQRFC